MPKEIEGIVCYCLPEIAKFLGLTVGSVRRFSWKDESFKTFRLGTMRWMSLPNYAKFLGIEDHEGLSLKDLKLFTTFQVAKRLGVHHITVRKTYIGKRMLEAKMIGRGWKIADISIKRFLLNQLQGRD